MIFDGVTATIQRMLQEENTESVRLLAVCIMVIITLLIAFTILFETGKIWLKCMLPLTDISFNDYTLSIDDYYCFLTFSDSFKETENAPAFSSRRLIEVVPGIGTTSEPLANTQAKANWAGVHPLVAA